MDNEPPNLRIDPRKYVLDKKLFCDCKFLKKIRHHLRSRAHLPGNEQLKYEYQIEINILKLIGFMID